MRLKTVVADYFSFNQAEQRGIAVLATVLFGVLLLNRFLPSDPEMPIVQDESYRREVAGFTARLRLEEQNDNRVRKSKYRQFRPFPVTGRDTLSRTGSGRGPLFTVEINSADTLELQRLKGIGPGFARRIVAYRNKLGGYVDKRQLLEIYGMDAERYRMISAYIKVDADSVHPIDINQVTFKELMSHPYFSYEVTREIILTRKKIKRFASVDELRQVNGVSDTLFRKISPYVVVK